MPGKILVTGGAGYIGSHVVKMLVAHGYQVVVLDDLSTGNKDSVLDARLIIGKVGDRAILENIFSNNDIVSVMHFAAKTVVPESVADPMKYYLNNTSESAVLLEFCHKFKIPSFVFSSTAAVYGNVDGGEASEETPTNPINPYGKSKLMTEWMLEDTANASGMKYIILRYFNVSGCDPDGMLGQKNPNSTLLIKVASEVVAGKKSQLVIFGNDYDTPDGTGVRDYIHVTDLADAHVKSLEYLSRGGESTILNCGYGKGHSVLEVVSSVERESKKTLPVKIAERRPGDAGKLIAKADKIKYMLRWQPQYDDLDFIVRSSLSWEVKE